MKRVKDFSQKHVIIFSAIVTLISIVLLSIDFDGASYNGVDMLIMHIILAVLAYFFIVKLDLNQNFWNIKQRFLKGFILGSPLILLGILSGIFTNLKLNINVITFNGIGNLIMFTLNMLMVGVTEEFIFRGLVLNNMLHKWEGTENGKRKAVIISAIVFGAIHLLAIVIAPPLTAIIQCINAASAGLLFGAVYLYCRNIWPVVIIHALSDWFALFLQECFKGATTSVIAAQLSLLEGMLVFAVGSLVPLLIAFILLKKYNNYERL